MAVVLLAAVSAWSRRRDTASSRAGLRPPAASGLIGRATVETDLAVLPATVATDLQETFQRADGKRCKGLPYTYDVDMGCDGWNSVTATQCWDKCMNSARADGCPQKTCAGMVYYPVSGWCHLYDHCVKLEAKLDAVTYTKVQSAAVADVDVATFTRSEVAIATLPEVNQEVPAAYIEVNQEVLPSVPTPWRLADFGQNCQDGCERLGLLCDRAATQSHLSEVNSPGKMADVIAQLGESCSTFRKDWGSAADVPVFMANMTGGGACFVSNPFRAPSSWSCTQVGGEHAEKKRRLCMCVSPTPVETLLLTPVPTLAPTTPTPTVAAQAESGDQYQYRKITFGSCDGVDMRSIVEKGECERAAAVLHMHEQRARPIQDINRPEGCYNFRNDGDSTNTLWFNTEQTAKGKGAETSVVSVGAFRQPICARRPEREQAPTSSTVIAAKGGTPMVWAGCYREREATTRTLADIGVLAASTQGCAFKCQEFKFMVLQDGGMCRCTDLLPGDVGTYRKMDDGGDCGAICLHEGDLEPRRYCGSEKAAAVYQLGRSHIIDSLSGRSRESARVVTSASDEDDYLYH